MKLQSYPKTRSFLRSKPSSASIQTDIQSSCGQLTPKTANSCTKKRQIRKRYSKNKVPKRQVFHQRIYRFTLKRTKKTMRIYCYKQSDLGWPKKFTNKLCEQEIDNDMDSDSEIIEYEVQRCKNNLLQQINRQKIGIQSANNSS